MELGELKGVGSVAEQRLQAAGVEDVADLAEREASELTAEGMSESKAETLIGRAKRESVVLQPGSAAREEAESRSTVSTGMEGLDDILDGGWREGHIAGISGEPGAGKTQVVFRALGSAVEQTGDPAVYIETERERFDPERIAALSDLTEEEVEENVWRAKAYDIDRQREAYEAVVEHFDDVSLVVVDSFTARFRLAELFEGRGSLTDRNSEMVRHLNGVERMADRLECPALLTLQIMGNPTQFSSDEATWGGTLMQHTLTYTVKMSHARAEFRKAELRGHPSLPEDEVLVSIGQDGISAHRED